MSKPRFLPDGAWLAVRHTLLQAAGFVLLLLTLALGLAFYSFDPSDPSFNTATDNPPLNLLGLPGAYAADMLLQLFGWAGAFFVCIFFIWSLRLMGGLAIRGIFWRILALICAGVLTALVFAALPRFLSWPPGLDNGGVAGRVILNLLFQNLGNVSFEGLPFKVLVALAAAGLAAPLWFLAFGITLAEWSWALGSIFYGISLIWRLPLRFLGQVLEGISQAQERLKERREAKEAKKEEEKRLREKIEPSFNLPLEGEEESLPPPLPIPVVEARPAPIAPGKKASAARQENLPLPTPSPDHYQFPPLSLLALAQAKVVKQDDDALGKNAQLLLSVLKDFGVKGEIVKVRPGPVVTLYELEPAPGTKTARVIGLSDDIARAMSALAVRIAVVPGRSVIGIEMPNAKRETVYLRELIASDAFERNQSPLSLALGKDIGGQPVLADLARMPHLLIAGTTGSGKSVGVNAMILSLLYRLRPEECRLIMIDPKMLELSVYDGIPHLLTPVVTDPKKAVVALKWAVKEMENRYRSMSQMGVRNIAGFNQRILEAKARGEILKRTVQTGFNAETGKPVFEEQALELSPLPFIVVIVDEMADLMLVAGKEVEAAIQRLAQMARAAGIHLIMATQRPSVDVITGTIKANFPTRISFQVTSKIDSRTILGEQGAEQLLGQGDMLYMAAGGRITRVHGPFVADTEVENIVAHLRNQGEPQYIEEVTISEEEGEEEAGEEQSGGDSLYKEAIALVMKEGKASTSFIQRHLQIGYNRAARIMDKMEKDGIVGPANHAGKREILGR